MQGEQSLEQTSLTPLLNRLAAFEPNGHPFITIYLDARANQHGRDQFHTWLKKELTERGKEYEAESPESQTFSRITERILQRVSDEGDISTDAQGVAIFVTVDALDDESESSLFEIAQFAAQIEENEIVISDRPYIFPMARLIEQNPRYICAWSDTNAAHIYIFGGELAVNAETALGAQVEEIHNVKTKRQQAGGQSQQRFQRRVLNFQQHHAKEVAKSLDDLVRDEKIDLVVLSGDHARAIQFLRDEMTKAVADKVIAELNNSQYDGEQKLHDESLEAVRRHDAEEDIAHVQRLSDEVGANNKGVTGVSATLAALSAGQVQEVLILTNADRIRYNPQRVEKVLADFAPGDDNSANDAQPDVAEKRQVLDEIIVRAINSSAKIRFIEDATLLMNIGGVGAILRYKIEENPETAPQS